MILIAAGGCALVAIVLAAPVSTLLARSRWTLRCPRRAIALWQVIGLGGGLLMLLALALVALAPVPVPVRFLALLALAGVAGRLLGVLLLSSVRIVQKLARQRRLVDLVATVPEPGAIAAESAAALRVLDHPEPVAYCLPGTRPRLVLSRGTIETLAPGELAAVIAHERAHARGRHELVVQPFLAWERTFPFLTAARRARLAVTLLVEILADDQARARVPAADLAAALNRMGGAACGDEVMVRARILRLTGRA